MAGLAAQPNTQLHLFHNKQTRQELAVEDIKLQVCQSTMGAEHCWERSKTMEGITNGFSIASAHLHGASSGHSQHGNL